MERRRVCGVAACLIRVFPMKISSAGNKYGFFLCIRCGRVVSKDTFSKHRGRCACCDQEDRSKAKEEGVCWNCGWPYTGEFADYKAPGGLCRVCFVVKDDHVMFGRQRWVRNGI